MKIPQAIENFIHANNNHNIDEFVAAFADKAIVRDEGKDYYGTVEIKEWCEEKCIQPKVILEPVRMVEQSGTTIVTAKVDGNFDKTGLPDPLYLDFHFTIDSNKVAALSIHLPQ